MSAEPTPLDTATESRLAKIRGLLDKAESTEFPDEADALRSKAAALMARYRIDRAMIDAARPAAERREVIESRVNLGAGPYVRARLRLLDVVAGANDCRTLTAALWDRRDGFVIGTRDDVEVAEMMYTSLLIQATRAAQAITGSSPARTRSERRSFLFGFAAEIERRLGEQNRAAEADAAATPGVALVLADKRTLTSEFIERRYGRVGSLAPTRVGGRAGYDAGRAAGRDADLSTTERVAAGARGALGR